LYRSRGTVEGLRGLLELASGARVEIADGGGVSWSAAPGGALPGRAGAELRVRVVTGPGVGPGASPSAGPNAGPSASPGAPVDVKALDALISAAKPAHVVHTLEVVDR
jgi:hypothetical protein